MRSAETELRGFLIIKHICILPRHSLRLGSCYHIGVKLDCNKHRLCLVLAVF